MGPIERELRMVASLMDERDQLHELVRNVSNACYAVTRDASEVVAGGPLSRATGLRCLPDVLSEAIEAAEALGL